MRTLNTDHVVNVTLHDANHKLAAKMNGDCVLVNSNIMPPLDDIFRTELEEIKRRPNQTPQKHLIILLQTPGGYMETVERLVAVMRFHYERVSFIIPNYAFSAGTVLALSGDDIHMDYYSVLGPIDPQYLGQDGNTQSGYGVLAKFGEICEKINESEDPNNCRAEMAYLIKNFDPGQLFLFEQAIEHGKTLITEWLPKYKFKSWDKHSTTGKRVTDTDKKTRAAKIAEILGDASRWHSHGRGISMRALSSSDLKLKIKDFGANHGLNELIRNYHGLAIDYFDRLGHRAYIHSQLGNKRLA